MIDGAAGAAPQPARERVSGVLGIALGLALLLGCGALLLLLRPRGLDPSLALEGSFRLGELPDGMRLERAVRLPGGETLVVLTDGRELGIEPLAELAAGPEEREGPAESGDGVEGADGEALGEKVDWSRVEEREAGTPPARLFLVRFPEASAERALDRQFRGVVWKELTEIGAQGGRLAVEGGQLAWGPYAADFVRERRFEPELAFHDALRVNLARPGRCWIAYAFWPEGYPGSKSVVEELLGALPPVEESAGAPLE